jgi:hypothetical protein
MLKPAHNTDSALFATLKFTAKLTGDVGLKAGEEGLYA